MEDDEVQNERFHWDLRFGGGRGETKMTLSEALVGGQGRGLGGT